MATAHTSAHEHKYNHTHAVHVPVTIDVVQLAVERVQTTKDTQADATGSNSADVHALHIVRTLNAVSDVPAAVDDLHVRRDVVPDLAQRRAVQ